jgi:hypothetical protein
MKHLTLPSEIPPWPFQQVEDKSDILPTILDATGNKIPAQQQSIASP